MNKKIEIGCSRLTIAIFSKHTRAYEMVEQNFVDATRLKKDNKDPSEMILLSGAVLRRGLQERRDK